MTTITARAARRAALLISTLALAAPAVAAAEALEPGPAPTRAVLTPTATPSTSQAFTWRTDAATRTGGVEIMPAAGGLTRTVAATAGDEVSLGWSYASRHHSAVVDGLAPATAYRYRVGQAGAWSPWSTFTTAGGADRPWTMLYFGDAQNDLRAKWSPVVAQSLGATPDVSLSLHAGDLINNADADQEWTDWFDAMEGARTRTNTVATPGNHELTGDPSMTQFTEHFSNPLNGPRGQEETAYFTDFQGVRIISLNTNVTFTNVTAFLAQTTFLEQALASNPNRWSVVTFHHPIFSGSTGRDNPHVRALFQPIIERHDVDLVLQGHDHVYSRGHMTDNGTGRPGESTGPVYVVSVSGPKFYETTPAASNNWTQNGATRVAAFQETSTFQQIRFERDRLRYRAIVAAVGEASDSPVGVGETLDAFTITKDADGRKLVREGADFSPAADAGSAPADGPTATSGPTPASAPGAPVGPAGADPAASGGRLRLLASTWSARTGRLRLRLALPAGGLLRATATTPARGGRAVAARGTRRADKRGVTSLTLRPTAAGRRLLRRGRPVTARVRVTLRPAGATRTLELTRSVRSPARR
jgi:hypothetical protein